MSQQPSQKEVVILGGGVIGLCSAYYLQQKGCQVTLLDRGVFFGACSKENAGLIVPSHIEPLANPGVLAQGLRWLFKRDSPFRIKPRASFEMLCWLWAFRKACHPGTVSKNALVLNQLLQESRHLFQDLSHHLGFTFSECGLLMVHRTPKGHRSHQELGELAHSLGLQAEDWTSQVLFQKEPAAPTVSTGAVYFPSDAHLNPETFLGSMLESLRAKGVQLLPNTQVQRIYSDGRIETAGGTIKAKKVVIACGSWSTQLTRQLGHRLSLQPGKGYTLTTEVSKPMPKIPMILAEEKVSITPLHSSMRFGGTLELAGLDPTVNLARAKNILEVAGTYQPKEPSTLGSRLWSGFRPCTPDGLPHIGYLDQNHIFAVATGHAMLGMTLGPVTGKLISELLVGQKPCIALEPLAPKRF